MRRACDTTTNDILNHSHGRLAMTVHIFVAGPNELITVHMVQTKSVEADRLDACHRHDGSNLRVMVQWA